MLKNLLLTFIFLISFTANCFANSLNTVVLSEFDGQTAIVLRSDEVTKVKKDVESVDKVVLTLKNITKSENISTLYKNITDVNGLIIQDDGNGDLKIYVEAPEISKANIVFETPNSAPITVINNSNSEMTFWGAVLILLLAGLIRFIKSFVSTEPVTPSVNDLIKEREMALYKSFQREVATIPSINYKLKGYRKHVLKGETIRSYVSRMSKV